jgi:hypothetical protein
MNLKSKIENPASVFGGKNSRKGLMAEWTYETIIKST